VCFVPNKGVVCTAYTTSEHFGMFRPADNRREEALWVIGAGKTSANSSRAIVEDDWGSEKGISRHCEGGKKDDTSDWLVMNQWVM